MSKNININKLSLLKLFIAYVLFSGIIIICLYNVLSFDGLYAIKDFIAIIFSFFVILISFNRFKYKIFIRIVPVFIFCFYGFLFSDSSLFLIIASLRQIFVPFLFIIIGYFIVNNRKQIEDLSKYTIKILLIIFIFGIFERLTGFWIFLDVTAFYASKNIPVFQNGYPVFWIEPVSIFGYRSFEQGIPRMVSTVLDPINFGHMAVFGFTLIYYEGRRFFSQKKQVFFLFIALLCVFLSFSKGSWLQLLLVFFLLNSRVGIFKRGLVAIMALPLILYYVKFHAGFMAHFIGFIGVFEYLSVFGYGLGSFGNYAAMYSQEYLAGVGDSYWAALLGQVGILGFFLWGSTFLLIARTIDYKHYVSLLLVSQMMVSALSENTFNFMSVFLLMIFVGAHLRLSERKGNFLYAKYFLKRESCLENERV